MIQWVRFTPSVLSTLSGAIHLALIRVKVFGRPELTLVGDDPQVGSRAYVIGAPLGLEFSITEGLLSQIQRINNVKQYQFSSPASPGNSGGPLLDADGQVLGVVSWQVKDGQNLNFAVPSSYLQGLDKTLPTMPWDAVRPSTATPATRPSSSSQPVGRMDRAVDRTLQEGLHATLPPKLSTLLGISAGTERPVMQSLLRSEKVVRGFDVLVANRNDVVIFIVNETANNQILYLTSRDGALQKMVSVKRGIGAVLQISSEDREAFEAEKQFWLDRLVPR